MANRLSAPTTHLRGLFRDDKTIVKNNIFAIYNKGGLTDKYLEKKDHLLILRPINPIAKIQIIDLSDNPQPIVDKIIGA